MGLIVVDLSGFPGLLGFSGLSGSGVVKGLSVSPCVTAVVETKVVVKSSNEELPVGEGGVGLTGLSGFTGFPGLVGWNGLVEVVILLRFSGFDMGFVTGVVVVLFGFPGLLGFCD